MKCESNFPERWPRESQPANGHSRSFVARPRLYCVWLLVLLPVTPKVEQLFCVDLPAAEDCLAAAVDGPARFAFTGDLLVLLLLSAYIFNKSQFANQALLKIKSQTCCVAHTYSDDQYLFTSIRLGITRRLRLHLLQLFTSFARLQLPLAFRCCFRGSQSLVIVHLLLARGRVSVIVTLRRHRTCLHAKLY